MKGPRESRAVMVSEKTLRRKLQKKRKRFPHWRRCMICMVGSTQRPRLVVGALETTCKTCGYRFWYDWTGRPR
jgi:hypothetical protein